eukprot:scaffold4446_cov75-Phaeocystis_antarctica.AAC.2
MCDRTSVAFAKFSPAPRGFTKLPPQVAHYSLLVGWSVVCLDALRVVRGWSVGRGNGAQVR